jgi:Mg2+ and Co2+ transporter CorA
MHMVEQPTIDQQQAAPRPRHTGPIPGLVWGVAFDEEGIGRPIEGASLDAALAGETGWVWLHLNLSDLRCRTWIESTQLIAESGQSLLLDTDEHLSLTAEDFALLGVFADFRRDFDHGTHDIARLRFVLQGRLLITARRHALHAIEEARRMVLAGHTFETGELLLESIVETFAGQVSAMVKELGQTLEKYEDRIVDDEVSDKDIRIGPIRRTVLRLHRQLSALRLHYSAFVDGEDRPVPEEVFAMVERVSIRLDGLGRDIETLQERARILQEEMSAKLANEANRQLYALSVMTALFLPATLVTGLFGMNTHGLPFDWSESGFWYALLVGIAGSGAVYLLLRWIGAAK